MPRKLDLSRFGIAHGANQLPEFRIWRAMILRCTSPNSQQYVNYGGRGISVCDRWRNSFQDFISDVGWRSSAAHSLDRINNDGNYEPGNVRWATRREQSNNRRANRIVEYRGERMTLANAIRAAGVVSIRVARSRLRYGWPLEIALETPPLENHRAGLKQLLTKAGSH